MNDLSRRQPLSESEMQEELDYITFCNAKRAKLVGAAIVAHFGAGKAARMEMRYQAEEATKRLFTVVDESLGRLSKDEHRQEPHSFSDPGQYCPGCGSRTCWCGQSRLLDRSEIGDRR